MTDEQSDLLMDLDDAIRWIYDAEKIEARSINSVRRLLDRLERTIE